MHNEQGVKSVSAEKNRIKKLPPLLVNQLAAGEVVTRPSSVVKELIENAIDAGATAIEVRITQGGMGVIEVSDNGCGIHPDDMVMAVTRFATSKIADVAHLQGIATLGFRGEALAATASVSRLTLKSSADDSGIGRELNVAGILEDTPELVPVVHPRGTTVTVRDLYFNVPARRGNLKSISTEYAHIEEVVKHLALVASDVSFSLWHNDKRRFNFEAIRANESNYPSEFMDTYSGLSYSNSPSLPALLQSALARLKAILPAAHSALLDNQNLQPLFIDLEGLRSQARVLHNNDGNEDNNNNHNSDIDAPLGVSGFLIPSMDSNVNNAYRLIYINGRLVKDRRIAQSMRESGRTLQSLGYVLFFTLPTSWLNLNVHPSKQCIKIQNLANVMAHLEVGVRGALQQWQKRQPERDEQHVETGHDLPLASGSNNQNILHNQIDNNSKQPIQFAERRNSSQASYGSQFKSTADRQPLSNGSTSEYNDSSLSVNEPSSQYQADSNQQFEGSGYFSKTHHYNDKNLISNWHTEIAFKLQVSCLSIIHKNDDLDIADMRSSTVKDISDESLVLLQVKDAIFLFNQSSLIEMLSSQLDAQSAEFAAHNTDRKFKLNEFNQQINQLLSHYYASERDSKELEELDVNDEIIKKVLYRLINECKQYAINELSLIDVVHLMLSNKDISNNQSDIQ